MAGKAVRELRWATLLGLLTAVMALAMICGGWALPVSSEPAAVATELPPITEGTPSAEDRQADIVLRPQSAPGSAIRFEHLSIEQGLSQSSLLCILQDSRGFMWFGTADGLNRYDGYGFRVYKHDADDPYSLSQGAISSLHEDQQGMLWIMTESGGIDRYDWRTDHFTHYRHDPDDPGSLSDNFVWDIYEDSAGTIWIATYSGGLNQYDRETDRFIHYRHDPSDPQSLSHDKVFAMLEDRAGVFWVGTAGGLDRFDRETGHFTHYRHNPASPRSLGSDWVQVIHEDRAGRFWVATYGTGLNLFDRETGRVIRYQHSPNDPQSIDRTDRILEIYEDRVGFLWVRHLDGRLDRLYTPTGLFTRFRHDPGDRSSLSHDVVRFIAEDRAGNLWVGTAGGLDRLDRNMESFIHYRNRVGDPHSLSDNRVLSFYEDRAGVLWIGTSGQGLNLYDPQRSKFTSYRITPRAPDSVSNNVVHAIYEDRSRALWIGTEAGLNRLDPEGSVVTRYRHDPGDPLSLSGSQVWCIREGQAGALWIGTEAGLDRLDPETEYFAHYRDTPEGSDGWQYGPVSILPDASGALWLGVYGWGLDRLDPETGLFTHYDHRPDSQQWFRDHTINVVCEDRAGALWMGTASGLERFDRATETFVHYQHDPGDPRSLSYDDVISIYEDRSGTLWIGTNGGGLNRFDRASGAFARYTEKDGLPNGVIYGILEDDEGDLWLSTNRGLSRFDPQTETFKNYDAGDGLQSDEFGFGAYYKSRSGEMFFGGVNGFNAFYPDSIQDNPYIPPVVLTSLTQGGEAVDLGTTIESVTEVSFRWPNNFFEFEFAALSYSQSDKNQYAYMLENFDGDWNDIGTRRFGKYTNLPGGTYTLRLKGSNSDGVWNEEGTSVRVTIVPPFWQTWWFRGVIALVLVGGVIGGYRLRVRSIEARTRELEGLVKDRTSALEQRTSESERRRQELEALYRADEKMHRYLHLDQVLQALVDVAVDILQADKSAVLAWDEGRERLSMRVARGFSPEAMAQLSFAPGEGSAGRVATSGEPAVVEDSLVAPWREGERAEILQAVDAEGIRSFMHLPIRIGDGVFGVFNVSFTQPHAFGADERRLFLALTQRAALAIENAQLYEQTQELAVAQERNRLARDLHDAVTQTLFSASLIAEALPSIWESDRDEGHGLLKEMQRLSRGALAEMRTLLLELRPAALTEASLGDLLRQLAEATAGREDLSITVTADGQCALPADVHVALYRIAQEALNNVVKHAHASHVKIGLRCTLAPGLSSFQGEPALSVAEGGGGVRVELCIQDDGCGFDPRCVRLAHLGLGIMRERAQAIGAALEVESQPGRGTRVVVMWRGEGVSPMRKDFQA